MTNKPDTSPARLRELADRMPHSTTYVLEACRVLLAIAAEKEAQAGQEPSIKIALRQIRTTVHCWHERAVAIGADGVENVIHAAEVAARRGALRCVDGFVEKWTPPLYLAQQPSEASFNLSDKLSDKLSPTSPGHFISTAGELRWFSDEECEKLIAHLLEVVSIAKSEYLHKWIKELQNG
jgi:hypothetical protein